MSWIPAEQPQTINLTVGEIVKLCLGIGLVFGLVALSLSLAGGSALRDVAVWFLRSFAWSSGIGATVIFVVVVLRYVLNLEGFIRLIGQLRLAERHLDAVKEVRLEQIRSDAVRYRIQAEAVATVSSARNLMTEKALDTAAGRVDGRIAGSDFFENPLETRLWRAVEEAYAVADGDGVLPNNLQGGVPFSRPNLSPFYEELRRRLADPGSHWAQPGTFPWLARLDEQRRTWVLNVRDYPTLADAIPVLFGLEADAMSQIRQRVRPPGGGDEDGKGEG
jgi:hypothetical protein